MVGDAHVFTGFLTPVLIQLFFPKPLTTFLTCFCRGDRQKYAGEKVGLNWGSNSQPPGHESDTLTTEPPRRGTYLWKATCSFLPCSSPNNSLRPVQIEKICRQQNKCHSEIKICF